MREDATRTPGQSGDSLEGVYVVVMAGGAGTRFWPLSTESRPKQFLRELTGRSLYEQAIERAAMLAPPERTLVMTNAAFEDLVREQSPMIPAENIILEPVRRDTAAAMVLASLVVEHRRPDSVMIVMPSDHLVTDTAGLRRTMAAAARRARQGGLGTVGVRPTYAATCFGYLHVEAAGKALEAQTVERFVEKPPLEKAREYVASGHYLWNAGMFIWSSTSLIEAARAAAPGVVGPLAALGRAVEGFSAAGITKAGGELSGELEKAFGGVEATSVDYGIMERHGEVWTVPADFDWNDLGGWLAACELVAEGEAGNRVTGPAALEGVSGSLVVATTGRPVVVVGLDDCVVVDAEAGVLVCRKDRLDRLKDVVSRLPATGEG